ncbi:CpsD/CapB family tyrosine-protein kinase [Oscillospiraceae bacterium LTW-04]|nr:CpsD/CapB family tyrosine-protein kinase [Oscillospiraceae bacterium MB24-C1]
MRSNGLFSLFRRTHDASDRTHGILIDDNTPFAIKEAYKTARTNLLFALATSENKCVIMTSALASEGKSTNCANLALTMSQTGASVLLIDADLRKSTQHKIFGISNTIGLAEILGGFCKVGDGVQEQVHPNLDIITAGQVPPNPSELLGSQNMQKLIEIVSKNYSYIFIDSPPVNIVTDALVLAKYAAGLIMCTRYRQSTHDEVRRAVASVEFANAKILGMIVCDVRDTGSSYYRKSYKSYKSYE